MVQTQGQAFPSCPAPLNSTRTLPRQGCRVGQLLLQLEWPKGGTAVEGPRTVPQVHLLLPQQKAVLSFAPPKSTWKEKQPSPAPGSPFASVAIRSRGSPSQRMRWPSLLVEQSPPNTMPATSLANPPQTQHQVLCFPGCRPSSPCIRL